MNNNVTPASDEEVEQYQSSGDEWEGKDEKKRGGRRISERMKKKPRMASDSEDDPDDPEEEDEDEDEEDEEEDEDEEDDDEDEYDEKKKSLKTGGKSKKPTVLPVGMTISNKDFNTGSFLVQKKDLRGNDLSKPPCLWRVDGKALLQKYEVFEEKGKTLHRSTSIYTGWSSVDKDDYAPVAVKVHLFSSQQMVVELDMETLKNINPDSD